MRVKYSHELNSKYK